MSERLLRLEAVEDRVGWKKSKIYQEVSAGNFPRPIKHGACNTWPESEINAYIERLMASREAR